MIFKDRIEAAHLLVRELRSYAHSNALVLALPRGGVPLGAVIARELKIPLDVILIKKIGHPSQPEYAIGALSLNSRLVNPTITLPPHYLEDQTRLLRQELQKRYHTYNQGREPLPIAGRPVLLVDDGIATGYTMMAAAQLAKQEQASSIVVAVPVAPPGVKNKFSPYVDEFICLSTPEYFQAVGQFYRDFSEVSHEEVNRELAASRFPENSSSPEQPSDSSSYTP